MARRWLRAFMALSLGLACWPAAAGAATADLSDPAAQWLPSSDGAEWVYAWSNSTYSPVPRRERYQVTARTGPAFRLSWREIDLAPYDIPTAGIADFKHSEAGLVNTNYQSTAAPPQLPLLCASAVHCGNSLAGSLFLTIWGTRSPVLAAPLVRGTRWDSVGGADNDVASRNRYAGREKITVPAFPGGVRTVKVESDVTQAGALGDPYGTGLRTVWWAYGVGPVKILFRHAGGETSTAELQSTTLKARRLPPQANPLPLREGTRATFRWRNSRHMRHWSRQRFEVSRVLNNTARVNVEDRSGPIDVAGSYVLSSRLSGVRLLSSVIRRSDAPAGLPRVGPRGGTGWHRRFLTPYDLMTYGYGPVIPAYAAKGQSWRSSRDSRDWQTYGVIGVSKVLGRHKVRTPAGRFRAVVVRSTLHQRHFRFGSGTRTSWFAPGKGLVKLVFRHDDGSVSRVERVR